MLHTQTIKSVFSKFQNIPLAKRLIPSLARHWLLATGRQYSVGWMHGLRWLLDVQTLGDRQMAVWGEFEEGQFNYLSQLIATQRPDVFLDIGAFAGYYAIRLRHRFPDIEVHAFEPHPRNRNQLCANLFLNDMSGKITVHALAVGDKKETATIAYASVRNRGNAMIGRGDVESFAVEVMPLDEALTFKNKIIFMKIDVEGYEQKVLAGMQEILKNNKCVMQVECWDENQEEFNRFVKELGLHAIHKIHWDHYLTN